METMLGANAVAMGNYRALVSQVDALEPLPLTVWRRQGLDPLVSGHVVRSLRRLLATNTGPEIAIAQGA